MKRILKLGTVLTTGGILGTLVLYPEAKSDFFWLFIATMKVMRCTKTILSIYVDCKVNGVDDKFHERSAKKLYNTLIQNGGAYIKFGQVIAHLDYLLPYIYVQTMQPCMQACPQSQFFQVKKIIEEDLGQKLEDIFDYFNPLPLASASLAQVHLATLKGRREKVAVKIQHEGLRQTCPGDIRLARIGVELAQLIFPNFNYR